LSATLLLSFLTAAADLLFGPLLLHNGWLTLVAYVLSFAAVAGFICWIPRATPATAAVPAAPRRLSPALFVWLLLLTPLLSILVEPLTMWLPMPDYMEKLFAEMFQRNAATFLMAVVAAPLCEEWMCRGVIARGLLRHTTPAKAIVWSAFIFALIHMNPWQALPAFVFGLLLGYVYWKTQSLWPCIFIHFIINGSSFLLMFLFPDLDANASMKDLAGDDYWLLYALAAVAAAYVGYLLYSELHKQRTP
jgi:membrane protease YdiL (CAAX protease family)